MTRRGSPAPRRDESPTSFTPLLHTLLERLPGALGAVLVDRDGEAVDWAGRLDGFDVKVAAAHLRLLYSETVAQPALLAEAGPPREIVVRCACRTYALRMLPEGYGVAVTLARGAFPVARPMLAWAAEALALEAGLTRKGPAQTPIDVAVGAHSPDVPTSLRHPRGEWQRLEILGSFRDREALGHRVRLHDGAEVNITRDARGDWWSDTLIPERIQAPGGHKRNHPISS